MERIKPTERLHDQILGYNGRDLPIGAGSELSIDDPVKVLAYQHYGYSQCEIFWFYLRYYNNVAWDVVSQEVLVIGDKQMDCLELSVSESTEDMKVGWTEKYYFDITDWI